jgi:hypothetical protein
VQRLPAQSTATIAGALSADGIALVATNATSLDAIDAPRAHERCRLANDVSYSSSAHDCLAISFRSEYALIAAPNSC